MRIYTRGGDLAFETFTFPDGQPHIKLLTYEREFDEVTIELAIRNPPDLFRLLLLSDVLRTAGYRNLNLDIRYLMGARMDRAIDWAQPFTLRTVSSVLNGGGFNTIRLLDVHSEVATRLIRNSVNVLTKAVVQQVIHTAAPNVIVCPDKGAEERVRRLTPFDDPILYCSKKRDQETGALSGFQIDGPYKNLTGHSCLIVDDICDGGGTFSGLAKVLHEAGAYAVDLYVTHGIFSRGVPLEGIRQIYCTNSSVDPYFATRGVIVVPISMKEL